MAKAVLFTSTLLPSPSFMPTIRYSYKFNVMVRGVQLFCSRSEQFQQICIESIDPSTKVDFVWPLLEICSFLEGNKRHFEVED